MKRGKKKVEKKKVLVKENSQELKYHLIFCSIIFVLTFAVYFNSLNSPFVYDDRVTIAENYYIRDFKNIIDFENFPLSYLFIKDRPLCTISYFIDYHFYKLNPTGYHITNTIFHILSAILIYFLIFTITKNFLLSLFTSLIFSLHPIQTEAVNAISFREDLIAMIFSSLSILAFIKSMSLSGYKKYLYYVLSLSSFTLGILSKETALILPLILLLYDFTFKSSGSIKEILIRKYFYLGYFFIILLDICYLYLARSSSEVKPVYYGDSIVITLLTMTKVFVYYVKNLLLPVSLYANYVIPLSHSIFEPEVLFSIAIIITLFIIAIKLYKTNKEISFGIFYFYITFLPISNIIPIGHLMHDRYLYMPSLGFCLILSYILLKLLKSKAIIIAIFSFILIFYSTLTIKQNKLWQDEIRLWGNVIRKFPDPVAYYNRGFTYYWRGEYDKAIEDYNKAVELNPEYVDAYSARANVYSKKGEYDKAIEDDSKAIELDPKYALAYYNRGTTYYYKGLKELAVKDFKRAAELGDKEARKVLTKYFKIEY